MARQLPLRKIRVYPSKVIGFERSCIVQEDGSFNLFFSRAEVKHVLESIQLSFRPIEAEDLEYFQKLDPTTNLPTAGGSSATGMQCSVSYDNASEIDKEIQRSSTFFPDSSLKTIISFLVGSQAAVTLKGQENDPIHCIIVGLEPASEKTFAPGGGAAQEKDRTRLNILVIPKGDSVAEKAITPILVSDVATVTPLQQNEIERALNLVHLVRNQNFSKITVHVKNDDPKAKAQPQVLVCRYALPNASTQDTHRVTINKNGNLSIQTLSAVMNESSEDWRHVKISFYQSFEDKEAEKNSAANGSSSSASAEGSAALETTLVAVLRGQSALIPISPLMPIAGRPIVLVDSSDTPKSALLLENNTKRRLKSGSLAVYDHEGNFLSDSSGFHPVLSDLDIGASTVLPYAYELSASSELEVTEKYKKMNMLKFESGRAIEIRDCVKSSKYTIWNNSDREMDVVILHSRTGTLSAKSRQPDVDKSFELRYYLRVPANDQDSLDLEEVSFNPRSYDIRSLLDETVIEAGEKKGLFTPEIKENLQLLLGLKSKLASLTKQLGVVQKAQNTCNSDLSRVIEILKGLGDQRAQTPSHQQLQAKYVQRIMEGEKQLASLQQQQSDLAKEVASVSEELSSSLTNLNASVKLDGSEYEDDAFNSVDYSAPSFARKPVVNNNADSLLPQIEKVSIVSKQKPRPQMKKAIYQSDMDMFEQASNSTYSKAANYPMDPFAMQFQQQSPSFNSAPPMPCSTLFGQNLVSAPRSTTLFGQNYMNNY